MGKAFHFSGQNVSHPFFLLVFLNFQVLSKGLSFPVLGGQRSDLYREMTADGVL